MFQSTFRMKCRHTSRKLCSDVSIVIPSLLPSCCLSAHLVTAVCVADGSKPCRVRPCVFACIMPPALCEIITARRGIATELFGRGGELSNESQER
jgi:hypothetical protein